MSLKRLKISSQKKTFKTLLFLFVHEQDEFECFKMIVVDPKKCSGCRLCEINCSLVHEGKFNPRKARLRVRRIIHPKFDITVSVCRQCKNAPCEKVCPTGAIRRDVYAEADVLEIDKGLCSGCMTCVKACPFGAIFTHPAKAIPFKCDLCHGSPVCTRNCPTKALTLEKTANSRTLTR